MPVLHKRLIKEETKSVKVQSVRQRKHQLVQVKKTWFPRIHTLSLEFTDQELNKKCLRINGLFPSHTCDKYVNCLNGLAVEQECPPELLFSENGYCDFAQNVDCKGRKISPGKVSNQYLVNQNRGTGSSAGGNLADRCRGQKGQFLTERCNTYLECWEGSAIERECPPGLFFSQIEGYCDFSHKVDCQNRVVPGKCYSVIYCWKV